MATATEIKANRLILNASNELMAATPDMLAALEFVAKYAAMRAEKGDPLPSQLTDSVATAIAKARPTCTS